MKVLSYAVTVILAAAMSANAASSAADAKKAEEKVRLEFSDDVTPPFPKPSYEAIAGDLIERLRLDEKQEKKLKSILRDQDQQYADLLSNYNDISLRIKKERSELIKIRAQINQILETLPEVVMDKLEPDQKDDYHKLMVTADTPAVKPAPAPVQSTATVQATEAPAVSTEATPVPVAAPAPTEQPAPAKKPLRSRKNRRPATKTAAVVQPAAQPAAEQPVATPPATDMEAPSAAPASPAAEAPAPLTESSSTATAPAATASSAPAPEEVMPTAVQPSEKPKAKITPRKKVSAKSKKTPAKQTAAAKQAAQPTQAEAAKPATAATQPANASSAQPTEEPLPLPDEPR